MDERFLHHIWKFQKLTGKLKTTDGNEVIVLDQGIHNHNSGPDFEEARIKIGNIIWAGKVENHINSSDWKAHNHHLDRAYNSVILHAVFNHDYEVCINEKPIPTLELKHCIPLDAFEKYTLLTNNSRDILCQDQLSKISDLTLMNLLDRMAVERLELKAKEILSLVQTKNADWEEITYLCLAKNFGFSINKEPFEIMASSLPFKVITKHYKKPFMIEALIFGQAGFLETELDSYQSDLKKEYEFLKEKFKLTNRLSRTMWKSGRMRPSNFPSVRLAQFATLISKNEHLFSRLIEISNPKEVIRKLTFTTSEYWNKHYDFGKARKKPGGNIGESTIHNLASNTIAPLFTAYSKYTGNQAYIERAMKMLEILPVEKNYITKKWINANKSPLNGFDSQALIGLYKNYCAKKRCLDCNIGIEILSK